MIQSLKQIKKAENSPYEVFKMGLGLTLGAAVDVAVTMAMNAVMPKRTGIKWLMAKMGVFVLGMFAGEKAEEYVYYVVDDFRDSIKETQQELLDAAENENEE